MTRILVIVSIAYLISPNLLFSENQQSLSTFLLTLMLIMYDDYSVFVAILSISLHMNYLPQWDTENRTHLIIYISLYAIHYYVIYLAFIRNYESKIQKHNRKVA